MKEKKGGRKQENESERDRDQQESTKIPLEQLFSPCIRQRPIHLADVQRLT